MDQEGDADMLHLVSITFNIPVDDRKLERDR